MIQGYFYLDLEEIFEKNRLLNGDMVFENILPTLFRLDF
jgi:hypothetical protein